MLQRLETARRCRINVSKIILDWRGAIKFLALFALIWVILVKMAARPFHRSKFLNLSNVRFNIEIRPARNYCADINITAFSTASANEHFFAPVAGGVTFSDLLNGSRDLFNKAARSKGLIYYERIFAAFFQGARTTCRILRVEFGIRDLGVIASCIDTAHPCLGQLCPNSVLHFVHCG